MSKYFAITYNAESGLWEKADIPDEILDVLGAEAFRDEDDGPHTDEFPVLVREGDTYQPKLSGDCKADMHEDCDTAWCECLCHPPADYSSAG